MQGEGRWRRTRNAGVCARRSRLPVRNCSSLSSLPLWRCRAIAATSPLDSDGTRLSASVARSETERQSRGGEAMRRTVRGDVVDEHRRPLPLVLARRQRAEGGGERTLTQRHLERCAAHGQECEALERLDACGGDTRGRRVAPERHVLAVGDEQRLELRRLGCDHGQRCQRLRERRTLQGA